MAKKADANKGRIEVEFVADMTSLAAAMEAGTTQEVQASGRDATPRAAGGGKRGRVDKDVQVDAEVNPKIGQKGKAKLDKDIQNVLDNADVALKLDLDTQYLRRQIENFLVQRFTLNLDIAGQASAGAGVAPVTQMPMVQHGATVSRAAPPQELINKMFQTQDGQKIARPFRDAIDNLYRNLSATLTNANKGRFGSQPLEPGNQVEKLGELMDAFGDDVKGWIETAGPVRRPTGGGSIMEFLKTQGIGTTDPGAMAMTTAHGSFGGNQRRAAEIFAKEVRKWWQANPSMVQPVAAPEQAPPPPPQQAQAARSEEVAKAIEAFETSVTENRQAVIEERQKALRFDPIRGNPATGPLIASAVQRPEDPEADKRARFALGNDRANVRRLRGRGRVVDMGGINVDLEPYLRTAEMGGFEDVFEQFGGKNFRESQGIGQFTPTDESGFRELQRLQGMKPGRKTAIAGQEGKFARLSPTEAMIRQIIQDTGIGQGPGAGDISGLIENLREELGGDETIRKAIDQGRSPRRAVSGETKRGQGSASMMGGGDLGKRLQNFDEWIDYAQERSAHLSDVLGRMGAALERASKNRDTGKVRDIEESMRAVSTRIQQFDSGVAQAILDRRELAEALDPKEMVRLSPEQQAIRNRQSQQRVAMGRGMSAAEQRDRALRGPEMQGQIGAYLFSTMGLGNADQGITPTEMVQRALEQRYAQEKSRVDAEGRSLTGKQVMRRAAFGPTGRARRNINEGEDAGIYGELASQIPSDLGRSSQQTIKRALSDLLSSLLESDSAIRDEAEKKILAKEGATLRGPIPARTTASYMNTDDPAYRRLESGSIGPTLDPRVAFNSPVTGEGEFLDAPGLAGRRAAIMERNRRIKVGLDPMPPEGSEYPYFDPDTDEGRAAISNMLEERRQRDITRQKTQGRGRYQTGDQTTDIAREAGIPMEDAPKPLPFAAFSEKYSGGGAGAGGGMGGGRWSGGSGGAGGWGFPIPLPVMVTNWPTGGGSWGGRPRPGRVTPGEVQPSEEAADTLPDRPAGGESSRLLGQARSMGYDPLGIRRARRPLTVKRTAMDIALQREQRDQERERERMYAGLFDQAAARDKQAAIDAEDPFKNASDLAKSREKAERRAADAQRRADAELARSRRAARVDDPVGFARERDRADTGLQEIRGENRAIQRRVPRRGFGASVTDLITSAFPGGALERQLEAADRAQREVNEINQAAEKRSGFITQRRGLIQQARGERGADGQLSDRGRALFAQAAEFGKAINSQTEIIKESTKIFEANSKVVRDNTAAAFGAAAVGSIGSIGIGALTFGLGSAVAAPIIEAVGTVLTNGLEKLFGDPKITSAMRTSLGEAARGSAGRGEEAFAQVAAQAGLAGPTYERLQSVLSREAEMEAGNRALTEQLGLAKLGERAASGTTLFTEGTGGFLDSGLFGNPSTQEQMGDFLRQPSVKRLDQGAVRFPWETVGATANNGDVFIGELETLTDRIQVINESLDKNANNMAELVLGTEFTAEQLREQGRQLEEAGAPTLGKFVGSGLGGFREEGTNRLLTGQEIVDSGSASIAEGARPSVRQLLDASRQAREARIEQQDIMRELSLNVTGPQGQAIALAQQGFGTGGPTGTAGIDPAAAARVAGGGPSTASLFAGINKDVQMQLDAAKVFVGDSLGVDAGNQFAEALGKAQGYAQQINDIQVGLQVKQAAFAAEQFSVSIGVAKRSLADAKGLVSGIGDSLGAIERQMFNLQREAQALQLGQSQRQINFQQSIAGFAAPGLTGEERAARAKQAKLEADFAQKQLNIQKELFGLQGRQFDISASRNVTDLTNQLALLEKGRAITLDTAAAEKRIQALTKLQEQENKKVETYYAAAVERTNDIIALIADIRAATGEAMVGIAQEVFNQMAVFFRGLPSLISGGMNQSGAKSPGGEDDIYRPPTTNAEGAVGTVNGATSFGDIGIAGEAGGEAFAILRDPKKLMSPMGGHAPAAPITVIVQGNKFSTQEEQDELVRKLTYEIEQAQARRLALTGLRT